MGQVALARVVADHLELLGVGERLVEHPGHPHAQHLHCGVMVVQQPRQVPRAHGLVFPELLPADQRRAQLLLGNAQDGRALLRAREVVENLDLRVITDDLNCS